MINFRLVIFCTVVVGSPMSTAQAADAAGNVVFAKGEVSAVDANDASRYLIRGDQVFSGDTIVTGDGRAQIKFTDGGYASIRSQTEYSLSEYVYRGAADGSERGFSAYLKAVCALLLAPSAKPIASISVCRREPPPLAFAARADSLSNAKAVAAPTAPTGPISQPTTVS